MKLFSRGVALVTALAVIASCGGSDSAQRTRNSALPEKYVLGYSCAQLVTDVVTKSTSEIRFTLCDKAGSYSIVTPEGVSGAVNDQVVQGGEEIAVPISSEVNGPESTLIVKIDSAPSDVNAFYHYGIHNYGVSLATVDADLVGADSNLIGTLYPKVAYSFPTPQTLATYRIGVTSEVTREMYAGYIDELAQKWAMVKLTTCHPNIAHARMSMAEAYNTTSAMGYAQFNAKLMRDRDLFVSIYYLRKFTASAPSQASICAPGQQSFNLYSNGIEAGYQPISSDKINDSTDVLALAKSHMLLHYWKQIQQNACVAPSGVSVNYEVSELETWENQTLERLRAVSDDVNTSSVDRASAQRLITQIELLEYVGQMRRTFDGVPLCAASNAGYVVPVKQSVEVVSSTLPSADTGDSPSSTTPLADLVNNPTPPVTIAPAQLVWSAANNVVQKIRVGQTLSKAQLAAQAGLALTAKTSVKLTSVGSSKKVCTVKTWGLKAVKVGTCKVRVTVATKGKKSQSTSLSLQVSK